jgi:hypothetical protein
MNDQLHISRRGRRPVPLALDIGFSCCYSCSSFIRVG